MFLCMQMVMHWCRWRRLVIEQILQVLMWKSTSLRSHSQSYDWTEGSYVHFVDTSHRQRSVGLWLSLTSCLDSCICCSRSVTQVFSSSTRAITLSRSSSRYALSCCPSTEESSCWESICQLQQIVFVHVCVCGEATQTMVATNKLYLHSLHSNSDLN